MATIVWAIVFDQGTKLWAGAAGTAGVEVAHNPRYALGVIGGSVPVLIVGTIAVLAVFVIVIVPFAFRVGLPAWIPGLVLGGAISNMIDRVRFGSVRDFISTHWAIINIADLFVLAGVLILPVLLAIRCTKMYAANEQARIPHPSRASPDAHSPVQVTAPTAETPSSAYAKCVVQSRSTRAESGPTRTCPTAPIRRE